MKTLRIASAFAALRHASTRRLAVTGVALGLTLAASVPAVAFAAAQHSSTSPCDVKCVQTFGDARVAERLAALTILQTRVNVQLNAHRITQDSANTILADVTSDTGGLKSLQSQIDSATDAATARSLDKQIYTTYRVYAVVLPRDRRLLALDVIGTIDGRLQGVSSKVQQRIAHAPAADQAHLQARYTDYTSKLAAVGPQVSTAQGQVGNLSVENFNNEHGTYKSDLAAYVTAEKAAFRDVKGAVSDLHQMRTLLKGSAHTQAAPAAATPAQ